MLQNSCFCSWSDHQWFFSCDVAEVLVVLTEAGMRGSSPTHCAAGVEKEQPCAPH